MLNLAKARIPTCFIEGCILISIIGCTKHEIDVKPVEIKPIHITIDVNVKVDRALDDFFGDLDQKAAEITQKDDKTEK